MPQKYLRMLFVVCSTAVWLVASMHCPIEVTGALPCDYCSMEVSPTQNAGSECPVAAARKTVRIFHPARTAATPAVDSIPLFEASMLSQSWQFLLRTAPAPRAPSFPA